MQVGRAQGEGDRAGVVGFGSLALLTVGVGDEDQVISTGGDGGQTHVGGLSVAGAGREGQAVRLREGTDVGIGSIEDRVGGEPDGVRPRREGGDGAGVGNGPLHSDQLADGGGSGRGGGGELQIGGGQGERGGAGVVGLVGLALF